jgi:hypothetical protein
MDAAHVSDSDIERMLGFEATVSEAASIYQHVTTCSACNKRYLRSAADWSGGSSSVASVQTALGEGRKDGV